jgi:hypothetical protein
VLTDEEIAAGSVAFSAGSWDYLGTYSSGTLLNQDDKILKGQFLTVIDEGLTLFVLITFGRDGSRCRGLRKFGLVIRIGLNHFDNSYVIPTSNKISSVQTAENHLLFGYEKRRFL